MANKEEVWQVQKLRAQEMLELANAIAAGTASPAAKQKLATELLTEASQSAFSMGETVTGAPAEEIHLPDGVLEQYCREVNRNGGKPLLSSNLVYRTVVAELEQRHADKLAQALEATKEVKHPTKGTWHKDESGKWVKE